MKLDSMVIKATAVAGVVSAFVVGCSTPTIPITMNVSGEVKLNGVSKIALADFNSLSGDAFTGAMAADAETCALVKRAVASAFYASPMYQIVVASSILTTLVNPFLIRASESVGGWAEEKLPPRIKSVLETYRGFVEKYRNGTEEEELRLEVKHTVIRLGVLAVLLFAVSTICGILYRVNYSRFSSLFEAYDRIFFFVLANVFALIIAPIALSHARTLGEDMSVILVSGEDQKWRQALRHLIAFVITGAVIAGFFVEAAMINISLAPEGMWPQLIVAAVMMLLLVFGWRFFSKAGKRATKRFQEALSSDERHEKLAEAMTYTLPEGASHRLSIDLTSPALGETVVSLNIRAKTGVSIISVERDGETIRNLGPELEFFPGDVLVALGDNTQIAALKDLLGITA